MIAAPRLHHAALVLMVLASSCSLPPKESWRIIQRDGLFNYWGSPNPGYSQSRYLAPSGTPFGTDYRPTYGYRDTRPAPHRPAVPYRPGYLTSRYVTESNQSRVTPPNSERSPSVANRSRPRPNSVKERPERDEDRSVANRKTLPAAPPVDKPKVADNKSTQANSVKESTPSSTDSLPFGAPVPGRTGMVTSPYANKNQLVDVAGMGAGQTVKCPYTGKLFRVPPTEQAAAKTTENPATKAPEAPKETPQ